MGFGKLLGLRNRPWSSIPRAGPSCIYIYLYILSHFWIFVNYKKLKKQDEDKLLITIQ